MKKFLFLILVFAGIYAEATDQYLSASKNDKWMFSTITGSGSASVNYIYSNYLANAAYTMDLPALSGVTDGASVRFINEVASGGIDLYTKLALHMDGSNDGTTFTDSSASAHTITRTNAVTKTGIKKFGTASGYFDGTGDYLTSDTHADFNMDATGDWTIDCWIYPTSLNCTILQCRSNSPNANQGLHISIAAAGQLNVDNGNAASGLSAGTISINTWQHIAVMKSSSSVYVFLGGTMIDSEAPQTYGNVNTTLQVGRYGPGSLSNDFAGYIDELRISKGVARFSTSGFTPPAGEYYPGYNLTVNPNGTERIFETATGGNAIILSTQGDYIELMKSPRGWYTVSKNGTITDGL